MQNPPSSGEEGGPPCRAVVVSAVRLFITCYPEAVRILPVYVFSVCSVYSVCSVVLLYLT